MTTRIDAEAGDYIEDDPAAWKAYRDVFAEYAARFASLGEHMGDTDGAADVLAGALLARLADQHGLYLARGKPTTLRLAAPVDRDGLDVERLREAMRGFLTERGEYRGLNPERLAAEYAALSAPEPKDRPTERFCNCASYCDADDPACPDFAAEDSR